jgi:hypothetical protein
MSAPNERFEGNVRLRGAAVWAAYGAVEAVLAALLGGAASIPPDNRYTLFLLVLYPLVGALLGRFAVLGVVIVFAANAIAAVTGFRWRFPSSARRSPSRSSAGVRGRRI